MPVVRRSLLIGTLLWALLIAQDVFENNRGRRAHFEVTISVRICVCVVGFVLWWLSHQSIIRSRQAPWVVVSGVMLFVTSHICFGVIEDDTLDPTFSIMVLLISSMTATFFRLRFLHAAAVMWVSLIEFVVITAASGSYSSSQDFLTTSLWLLVGTVVFSLNAYGWVSNPSW
jgi:predicted neutral ceramidase superfamily lipid hydrolase